MASRAVDALNAVGYMELLKFVVEAWMKPSYHKLSRILLTVRTFHRRGMPGVCIMEEG